MTFFKLNGFFIVLSSTHLCAADITGENVLQSILHMICFNWYTVRLETWTEEDAGFVYLISQSSGYETESFVHIGQVIYSIGLLYAIRDHSNFLKRMSFLAHSWLPIATHSFYRDVRVVSNKKMMSEKELRIVIYSYDCPFLVIVSAPPSQVIEQAVQSL